MPLHPLPALYAVLVFLFPLGLYFLILAHLNRGRRPVVVPGVWDSAGLLLGVSGFFLYALPEILWALCQRGFRLTSDVAWNRWWMLWAGYYAFVLSGAALMITLRRPKTAVYHVDPELFAGCFNAALTEEGLTHERDGDNITIRAAAVAGTQAAPDGASTAEPPAPSSGGDIVAELSIEPFPAMCHVTLHWDEYDPQYRRRIEGRLAAALEHAAPQENPASAWFLGGSGLIFAVITLVTLFLLLFVILEGRP